MCAGEGVRADKAPWRSAYERMALAQRLCAHGLVASPWRLTHGLVASPMALSPRLGDSPMALAPRTWPWPSPLGQRWRGLGLGAAWLNPRGLGISFTCHASAWACLGTALTCQVKGHVSACHGTLWACHFTACLGTSLSCHGTLWACPWIANV